LQAALDSLTGQQIKNLDLIGDAVAALSEAEDELARRQLVG
jgi:hypothetical protein